MVASPAEVEITTPGVVLVVDGEGRLVDRSPRAVLDPELGRFSPGDRVDAQDLGSADGRRLVYEGSALDALWFSRGEPPLEGGLDEREMGTMLHRVRNLVTVLVAAQETEEMLGTGPVSTRLGSTHRRELDRLVDVIGDLGHAFGPVGGRSFVDLESVLRRSVDSARGAARKRGVTLRLDGARDARRGRSGDENLLQACVDALLSNAIDASHDGGEVRVSVEASAAAITLRIEDDGPGLVPSRRGPLGTPFTTAKRGRVGLGLRVALRGAFVHGGELSVTTRGPGVTATLWLPVGRG